MSVCCLALSWDGLRFLVLLLMGCVVMGEGVLSLVGLLFGLVALSEFLLV